MWRRLRRSGVATAMALVGLTAMADTVGAANTPAEQRLLERIRVLEERLNKLEKIEGAPKPVGAAETPDMERLLERINVLEERLDRLERVEVIKKTVEYICPGGEILEQPPPGGRCPEGAATGAGNRQQVVGLTAPVHLGADRKCPSGGGGQESRRGRLGARHRPAGCQRSERAKQSLCLGGGRSDVAFPADAQHDLLRRF